MNKKQKNKLAYLYMFGKLVFWVRSPLNNHLNSRNILVTLENTKACNLYNLLPPTLLFLDHFFVIHLSRACPNTFLNHIM